MTVSRALADPADRESLDAVARAAGQTYRISQGSPSTSKLSAATHAGTGAVDLVPSGDWDAFLWHLHQHGWMGQERTPAQGFDRHIHALRVASPGLSDAARSQLRLFRAGRNGLAATHAGPYVYPTPPSGDDMSLTPAQETALKTAAEMSRDAHDRQIPMIHADLAKQLASLAAKVDALAKQLASLDPAPPAVTVSGTLVLTPQESR